MYINSVVFLLAAAGAYAAPVAKAEAAPEAAPEAVPWCWRPGEPCWKVKRAAEAAPEAAPEAVPWCWRPGEPCWKVKRAADVFAESIRSSGGLQERTPEAEYSNSPGGAAYMAKRSVHELANLAALAARDPAQYYRDLGLENVFERDEGHITKRGADADADAEPEAAARPWCRRPGQPCWKRDLSGSPIAVKDKRWCARPGQTCWKAKRAADAVLSTIQDESAAGGDKATGHHYPDYCDGPGILCYKKRSASPEASPDAAPEAAPEAAPWCWRPGQPCWKAKRDLHALELAARAIIDSHE